MGERDELIRQGIAEVQRQGWTTSPSTDAVRSLVDAGWRPPAEPLFEGRIKGLDAGGEVTVRNGDRNPITEHIQTGTEVAVYRKGDTSERPWVARKMDTTHTGLAAAVVMEPGPAPEVPPADLAEAVVAAAAHAEVRLYGDQGAAMARSLGRQGVTVRPRPKTDAERWEAIVCPDGPPDRGYRKVIDRLVASGAHLPELKERWSVRDSINGGWYLAEGGDSEEPAYQHWHADHEVLLRRVARLLNEHPEALDG